MIALHPEPQPDPSLRPISRRPARAPPTRAIRPEGPTGPAAVPGRGAGRLRRGAGIGVGPSFPRSTGSVPVGIRPDRCPPSRPRPPSRSDPPRGSGRPGGRSFPARRPSPVWAGGRTGPYCHRGVAATGGLAGRVPFLLLPPLRTKRGRNGDIPGGRNGDIPESRWTWAGQAGSAEAEIRDPLQQHPCRGCDRPGVVSRPGSRLVRAGPGQPSREHG